MDRMGVLLGLVQATPTVFPDAPDTSTDPMRTATRAVWRQFVDLLNWLGGISVTLFITGIVVGIILWITGRLRRRLRHTLEVRTKGKNNLPALIDNLLNIGVYIFVAIFAFSALGADSSAFVQAIGLITAAVSLSLQDVLKNFVAGIYLLAEEPFSEGDRLEVLDQVGTVERVTVRTTVIRNDKAEQVLVPNYEVFSKVVTNRSTYNLRSLTIAIAGAKQPYPDVLDHHESWLDGIEGMSKLPPKIDLTKVGPDGCDLSVTVWVTPGQDVQQAVIARLVERFPDATLTITA
jgi:small conductance mechanosensitive channel